MYIQFYGRKIQKQCYAQILNVHFGLFMYLYNTKLRPFLSPQLSGTLPISLSDRFHSCLLHIPVLHVKRVKKHILGIVN